MSLVCLDTQILIWAVKEEAEPGQEAMILRAKALLESLSNDDTQILLPAIVVGELLVNLPVEAHRTVINLLQRDYLIAQYDVRAAMHFAAIWRAKKDETVLKELAAQGKTRQELKADRMIVATAMAHSVECIYSHDSGVATFGRDFVDVRCVPDIPIQTSFLDQTNESEDVADSV